MTSKANGHRSWSPSCWRAWLEPVVEFIASRGGDSFARWLDSRPVEDEEISADEIAAIDEAHAELAAGEPTVSHEEMKRELGLG